MKTLQIIIAILFSANLLLAQKTVNFTNDSDTTFWYNYKNAYVKKFKLGFIEHDTSYYIFRYWSPGLVVKIKSNDNHLSGEIIRFVEAYPINKKGNTFLTRHEISSSKAKEVRQLIDSLQIETLPSDKNISGWQHGFDGTEYFLEFKQDGKYTFKNYWTPTAQGNLTEAVRFSCFITLLDRILDLKTSSTAFQNEIPFDSWTNPGSGTAVYRVRQK